MDKTIPGYDYVTGKVVHYTSKEWRKRYPATQYRRAISLGETWYRGPFPGLLLAAEAYAIIPAR